MISPKKKPKSKQTCESKGKPTELTHHFHPTGCRSGWWFPARRQERENRNKSVSCCLWSVWTGMKNVGPVKPLPLLWGCLGYTRWALMDLRSLEWLLPPWDWKARIKCAWVCSASPPLQRDLTLPLSWLNPRIFLLIPPLTQNPFAAPFWKVDQIQPLLLWDKTTALQEGVRCV